MLTKGMIMTLGGIGGILITIISLAISLTRINKKIKKIIN